jgi:hypothetical protein
MTDVIVNTITETVVIETEGLTTIVTVAEQGPVGPAGINKIEDATDVDTSNISNGSILVYSSQNQKWVATKQLENQIIESGQY